MRGDTGHDLVVVRRTVDTPGQLFGEADSQEMFTLDDVSKRCCPLPRPVSP